MVSPVLLISDTPRLCQQITDIIQEYPLVCCKAAEASLVCRDQQIRVVLVDENLVAMSGIALFDQLRAANPELVGLLIAAENAPGLSCQAALESGFSGLLCHPLDPDQLQTQVNRAMEASALREENARFQALLPLYGRGEKFLSSTTREEVLTCLLDVVADQTAADSLSVMLFDEEEGCLRIAASRGIEEELARTIKIRPGDKIAGWVFSERKPVILNRETQKDSPFADLLKRPEIVSAVSFPMIVRGRILGVLNVSYTDGEVRFAESSIEMLGILCAQAALALDNVRSLAELAQKTRLQTLLEQYVSPEVAELMLASNADLATRLGEIKEVTVLFADIRNFTGMVQHLPLAVLHNFLNEFFQVFTETIFQYQGTVDKFMGDAVLAIFGAPIELANANFRAVETALAIRQCFTALKERWQGKDPFFSTIDLGIALTCGEMFLGNVGSSRRLDYTVIGTEVNVAQRLAAKSSSCSIYITDAVRCALTGQQVTLTDMGEMTLRGVHQPVRAYSVQAIGKG
jgi:adenylate cyclase